MTSRFLFNSLGARNVWPDRGLQIVPCVTDVTQLTEI
jgi:hypothetical protein